MSTRRIFLLSIVMLCAALCIAPPLPAAAQADINALSKAVVQVRTPNSNGSGSLIEYGGELLVFTNRHVAEGHQRIEIAVLKDVHEPAVPTFAGQLRAFSSEYDLAVFSVTEDLDGAPVTAQALRQPGNIWGFQLPALSFISDEQVLNRGTPLALLGYPGIADDELVYTTGIVSSVQMTDYHGERVAAWYRTNAEMSPGNSGGLAFSMDGKVIGIPTHVSMEERTGGRLGSILSMPLAIAVMRGGDLLTRWDDYFDPDNHLNPDGQPSFGEHAVQGTALRLPLTAGGTRSAAYLGSLCSGYGAENPDVTITLGQASEQLTIEFDSEQASNDAVLIVRAADGTWHCNDDRASGSLDPGLTLEQATAGTYQVWVGGYQAGNYFDGNLRAYPAGVEPQSEGASQGFRINDEPLYGTVQLSAFFMPDPNTTEVIAGGNVDVSSALAGTSCTGYAAGAPDIRMHFSGNSAGLKVYFVAEDLNQDATLIVNTPDGSWHCNDDAHGGTLNPLVDIGDGGEGRYDIWIGSYRAGQYIRGELHFTEMSVEVP